MQPEFNLPLCKVNYQGCAVRKIARSPKIPKCEIQGTQHKSYMIFFWSPEEHSPGYAMSPLELSESPGYPMKVMRI